MSNHKSCEQLPWPITMKSKKVIGCLKQRHNLGGLGISSDIYIIGRKKRYNATLIYTCSQPPRFPMMRVAPSEPMKAGFYRPANVGVPIVVRDCRTLFC